METRIGAAELSGSSLFSSPSQVSIFSLSFFFFFPANFAFNVPYSVSVFCLCLGVFLWVSRIIFPLVLLYLFH